MKRKELHPKTIESAKILEKPYRITDGRGLYILIKPSGGKLWRFDYTIHRTRKTMALGSFPDITLEKARQRHSQARTLVAQGIDPMEQGRQRNNIELGKVFNAWLDLQKTVWTKRHLSNVRKSLSKGVFSAFLKKPIGRVASDQIAQKMAIEGVLEPNDKMRRNLTTLYKVFEYAKAQGYVQQNPIAKLKDTVGGHIVQHYSTAIEPGAIRKVLLAIHHPHSDHLPTLGIQLIAYTFVRSSELRLARWSELDLQDSLWRIPRERMGKNGQPHLVPLASQARQLFLRLRELNPDNALVFPGRSGDKPIADNAFLRILRTYGLTEEEMSVHGFRAMASTILHEREDLWRDAWIETQLAHQVGNRTSQSYNYAKYLKPRREMMQWYADHLDQIRNIDLAC